MKEVSRKDWKEHNKITQGFFPVFWEHDPHTFEIGNFNVVLLKLGKHTGLKFCNYLILGTWPIPLKLGISALFC